MATISKEKKMEGISSKALTAMEQLTGDRLNTENKLDL